MFMALLLFLSLAGCNLHAQTDNLPPKPDRYVTDQAGVLDSPTAQRLNSELAQFERETSNQILVVIYPNLPPGEDAAQYATYTGEAWGTGQKGKDNGAILFVFVNDHKVFIATGRGLEGDLPDATCKEIISQLIVPQFKRGNYNAGITAGLNAMIAATKGEYQGNGTTVSDNSDSQGAPLWLVIVVIVIIVLIQMKGRFYAGPIIFTGGGWGDGGGRRGGGGYSGGGGSFGGGGAGGSW